MEKAELSTGGRRAIEHHPVGLILAGLRDRAFATIVGILGRNIKIRADQLRNKVGFSDPRSLLMRNYYGNGVTCGLQCGDEWVDVW